MRSILRSVSFALLSLAPLGATAQTYPDKPIKMIVANTPGTSHDLFAREVAPKAAEILGQPIVIDNRGGAGSIIGTEIGGRSTPDGYTIVLGTGQSHAINVGLHKTLPYDPVADFTPVARLAAVPLVMVVTASLPVKTVAELVALAKQKPGQLNFASSGNGTSAHLAGELFKTRAGVNIVHVPYKGASQALTDLIAGTVPLMIYPYQPLSPFINSGKVTALALAGLQRGSYLPNVPTMIESGFPDFVMAAWFGLWGPKGMPRPIVDKLHAAFSRALSDPAIKARLAVTGTDLWLSSPEQLGEFTRSEIDRYRKLIEISGAKVD